MAIARTPLTLATLLAGASAFAHPGHAAPPIHAHDIDFAAPVLVAALIALVIGYRIRARATHKRKSRP